MLLERQFRYPHRRDFIEMPAGKLEPGEPPLDTAKRELLEETGYVAAEWTRLGVIHTAIGYTDEAIELSRALARGCEPRASESSTPASSCEDVSRRKTVPLRPQSSLGAWSAAPIGAISRRRRPPAALSAARAAEIGP